jgi:tRNA (Thr-GGU) A37 N-methylase
VLKSSGVKDYIPGVNSPEPFTFSLEPLNPKPLNLYPERHSMAASFYLNPVGIVGKSDGKIWIEVFDQFTDGLLGLDGFSHIFVLYWFHQNDAPEKRRTLQVHPRKDPGIPLTGVFATHSPQRPNLIGLTLCRILSIEWGSR